MRIVCPACETAYDVPDAVLAPGRLLRCARCRGEWAPVAMPLEEAPDGGEAPVPVRAASQEEAPPERLLVPVDRVAAASLADRPAGPRVAVIAGWLVSLLVLGGVGYAAVIWRQPIAQAWPPAGRAYAWLGYL